MRTAAGRGIPIGGRLPFGLLEVADDAADRDAEGEEPQGDVPEGLRVCPTVDEEPDRPGDERQEGENEHHLTRGCGPGPFPFVPTLEPSRKAGCPPTIARRCKHPSDGALLAGYLGTMVDHSMDALPDPPGALASPQELAKLFRRIESILSRRVPGEGQWHHAHLSHAARLYALTANLLEDAQTKDDARRILRVLELHAQATAGYVPRWLLWTLMDTLSAALLPEDGPTDGAGGIPFIRAVP